MSSIVESLAGQLMKSQLAQITEHLGSDPEVTKSALASALPLLMGALAKNAAKPEGAAALFGALERDHDGSALDDVTARLHSPNLEDGNGILGHILGGQRGSVEEGLSKASGLDAGQVGKMLAMLAPLMMGAVGKARQQRQVASPDDLTSMLNGEKERLETSTRQLGMLGKLLDRDGDGKIADDLGGVGKSLLGKMLGGRN